MADSGFDPCECVWNHEMAMRRLLSILRQSQGYCTDNECLDELPGPNPSTESALGDDPTFLVFMVAIFAMAMYYLFPSSLRGEPDGKPSNNQGGGTPPAPPTST